MIEAVAEVSGSLIDETPICGDGCVEVRLIGDRQKLSIFRGLLNEGWPIVVRATGDGKDGDELVR